MNLIKKSIAVASLAFIGASPSHAQVPDISVITGLLSFGSLPGLDSLPSAGGLPGLPTGGGLPGLDALPSFGSLPGLPSMGGGGQFGAIPVFGNGIAFIAGGDFLPRLLPDPVQLMQLAGGQAVVTNIVLGAIGEPEAVFSTVNELGVNAGVAAVPVLGVLMENPAGLLDYFMAGGTVFTQALDGGNSNSIFPGAPLLTQPLSL